MLEWLSQQNAGQVIAILAISGGITVAVVSVLSGAWVRVRRAEFLAQQAETDAALKQQMIERGMSADEIERVLAAGVSRKPKKETNAEERVG
jgi:hypothetical protein